MLLLLLLLLRVDVAAPLTLAPCSRRDGRLVTKCIMRAWRTVVCERVLGLTLNDLADVVIGVQDGRMRRGAKVTQAAASPVAAAAATKRTCQWAAHAEKRRQQLRMRACVRVWLQIVEHVRRGR